MSSINFKMDTLPSKGLFYPKDAKFSLKKYSLDDVTKLNSEDRNIEQLIDDFVKDFEGIDISELLYIDFLYMSLYRTATIYNNNSLTFELTCPHCGKNIIAKIEYLKVELADIQDFLDLFPLKLKTNPEIEFHLPTVSDILKLIELQKGKLEFSLFKEFEKQDMDKLSQDERLEYKRLKNIIIEYQKEDTLRLFNYTSKLLTFGILSNKEVIDTIDYINKIEDGEDLECLTFLDEVSSLAFKPYKLTCKECAESIEISLEGVASLLRPFCPSKHDIANRIRASKKS